MTKLGLKRINSFPQSPATILKLFSRYNGLTAIDIPIDSQELKKMALDPAHEYHWQPVKVRIYVSLCASVHSHLNITAGTRIYVVWLLMMARTQY